MMKTQIEMGSLNVEKFEHVNEYEGILFAYDKSSDFWVEEIDRVVCVTGYNLGQKYQLSFRFKDEIKKVLDTLRDDEQTLEKEQIKLQAELYKSEDDFKKNAELSEKYEEGLNKIEEIQNEIDSIYKNIDDCIEWDDICFVSKIDGE